MLDQSAYSSGLLVDLYHLDAAYVAWSSGVTASATFDLYTRKAPFGGSYVLVAGLQPALEFVSSLQFTDDDLAFIQTLRPYSEAFLTSLQTFRFSGDILAMAEGEVAFAHEPLLRVTAPFIEALLVESGLLHTIGFSSLIATKAARIVRAAAGRPVAEFGYRRAQEPFLAARSSYIGGCTSTSFVAAARRYGIPASGTIPHALIEAFPTEAIAFRAVAESIENYSLLLDTYDVTSAIHTAVEIAHDVKERLGHTLTAVRLDSGDLAAGSRMVRSVLDAADLRDVRILVSGDLDEWSIAELVASGAPIDGFGVGTSLAVGAGSTLHDVVGGALGTVYKLAWYEGDPDPARIKIAGDKSTWPGMKQVIRTDNVDHDTIQLESEAVPPESRPLLRRIMHNGKVEDRQTETLQTIRSRARSSLSAMPARLHSLDQTETYSVVWSQELQRMRAETIERHSGRET